MIMLDPSRYREAYASARRADRDMDWFGPVRDRALEALLARGLPDSGDEDWRYTNLDSFARRSSDYLAIRDEPAVAGSAAPDAALIAACALPGWTGPRISLVDGQFCPALSTTELPAGLLWQRLAALPEEQRVATATRWPEEATDRSALIALNTAFLSEGLLLHAMARATPPAPVLVSFAGSGRPVHAEPRLLIDLAEHASLTLVIHHCGTGASLANVVTEIHCRTGANLRFIRVQESGDDALQLESTRIRLDSAATAQVTTIDVGGRLSRHDLHVSLDGEGAGVDISGLFLANGARHLDNHTCVEHNAPHTRSRETFRGILDDRGRGVFNGKIIVRPGAIKTDAALTNRNLLLTRTAEIDTKPELEIFADDVRCSHGATTGQLDPGAMFYLRSRGIDVHEARRLLVTAFAREIADSIAIAPVRHHLDELLVRRLAAIGAAESP